MNLNCLINKSIDQNLLSVLEITLCRDKIIKNREKSYLVSQIINEKSQDLYDFYIALYYYY